MIFQRNNRKKDLVLGAWEGELAFVKLAPFIISLKKSGFEGDVCFLVNKVGMIDRLFLRLTGVNVIKIDRAQVLREVSPEIAADLSSSFGNSEMSVFRYLAHFSFLSKRRGQYSHVLLADLRDVVFQKDPFDFDLGPLCLFRERRTISGCPSNSAWIQQLFGEEVLHEIGGNIPYCSGIIMGAVPEILDLIKDLLAIPLKEPARWDHNQGILNYYVYKLRPANITTFTNEDGPVIHLGMVSASEVRLSSDGLVLNESGDVVNIVHQYDRHPALMNALLKKYSYPKPVYFIYFKLLKVINILKYAFWIFLSACSRIFPKSFWLINAYNWTFGRMPNLINPKTINEKILRKILFDRNRKLTLVTDKFLVRDFVRSRLGTDKYLTKLHGVIHSAGEIRGLILPNQFVMKPNHLSGAIKIVKDFKNSAISELEKLAEIWLARNFYYECYEWAYKNIKPLIIFEELLESEGKTPDDWKFFCFNGKPQFIQFDKDRFMDHKRNIYDLNLRLLPVRYGCDNFQGEVTIPKNFEMMLEIAGKLSKGFDFIRVDLYNIRGRVIFGELTVYTGAGRSKIAPAFWDEEFGRYWR